MGPGASQPDAGLASPLPRWGRRCPCCHFAVDGSRLKSVAYGMSYYGIPNFLQVLRDFLGIPSGSLPTDGCAGDGWGRCGCGRVERREKSWLARKESGGSLSRGLAATVGMPERPHRGAAAVSDGSLHFPHPCGSQLCSYRGPCSAWAIAAEPCFWSGLGREAQTANHAIRTKEQGAGAQPAKGMVSTTSRS